MHQDSGGWFVAPTVIDNVTPAMAVAREEIFGPVVAVLPFDTDEEALGIANDTDYGLAATVWSRDIDQALKPARGVRAGTVAVNGYSEGDIGTPFGGYTAATRPPDSAAATTASKPSSSTPSSRPSGSRCTDNRASPAVPQRGHKDACPEPPTPGTHPCRQTAIEHEPAEDEIRVRGSGSPSRTYAT
ncbi:aldehyde dehydrogenase family protein [Streptomyces sp. NPDC050625]|uniref:aldehyde dehydrogenase family protein n=1 Tax=Streptomyces sp. NPDC050625 TaxID=3154629 RepID=UPI0034356833